jgi:hypothetical protein
MLSDEQRQVGALLTVIPLADAQLLESYFGDKKVFRHSLSSQTIALLSKLNRQKKEFSQKAKELREKMLSEQLDKNAQGATEKISEAEKSEKTATKQSLFGFPQDKKEQLKATAFALDNQSIKETTQRFLNWLRQNPEKHNLPVTRDGVVITPQVLQNFIAEHKQHPITLAQLQEVLNKSGLTITIPVSLSSQEQLRTNQPGAIQQLIMTNPYLVFSEGSPTPNATAAPSVQPPAPPPSPEQQTPKTPEPTRLNMPGWSTRR